MSMNDIENPILKDSRPFQSIKGVYFYTSRCTSCVYMAISADSSRNIVKFSNSWSAVKDPVLVCAGLNHKDSRNHHHNVTYFNFKDLRPYFWAALHKS